MAINTHIMGQKPDLHLETSLFIQRVSTLLELLSRAKQYIEFKDLTEHYRELVVYINSVVFQGELDKYVKNPRGHQQDSVSLPTKRDVLVSIVLEDWTTMRIEPKKPST